MESILAGLSVSLLLPIEVKRQVSHQNLQARKHTTLSEQFLKTFKIAKKIIYRLLVCLHSGHYY